MDKLGGCQQRCAHNIALYRGPTGASLTSGSVTQISGAQCSRLLGASYSMRHFENDQLAHRSRLLNASSCERALVPRALARASC